jgi:hypothetical protein
VGALERAGADTVTADNAPEALRRIDQFSFDAAVVDGSPGAEGVAERLTVLVIPFCVCGAATATGWRPSITTRLDHVVPALQAMLEEG